jgi:hypothetical protein
MLLVVVVGWGHVSVYLHRLMKHEHQCENVQEQKHHTENNKHGHGNGNRHGCDHILYTPK